MPYTVLLNNDTGKIQGYSKFLVPMPSHGNFSLYEVPEEFTEIFEKINQGKAYATDYKLEITETGVRLVDAAASIFADPEYGKMVAIPFHVAGISKKSIGMKIVSVNNKPCLIISANDMFTVTKAFDIHFTGKNDLTAHYETFHIDVDELISKKELCFEFQKINHDRLWANDFTIYYRKVFTEIWYSYR
jgi:hypothetical protein